MAEVIVREAGFRPVRRGEWSPTGLIQDPRWYRFTKSEYDDLIEKAQRAVEDAEDGAAAERAALALAELGSKVVRSGVLQQLATAWVLRKSEIDARGEPATLATRIHQPGRADYAAYLDDLRKGRVDRGPVRDEVARRRHHDAHCPEGAACEIEAGRR